MDADQKQTTLYDILPWSLQNFEKQNWQALLVFSIFRCCLATTFLIFIVFKVGPAYLGYLNPTLFKVITSFYLFISLFALFYAFKKKVDFDLQVNVPIFFDILCLTFMMHLSGGVLSGLGLLLIIIVASHSLLAQRLLALSGAALSSCAILAEELYLHFSHLVVQPAYSQAGLLGFSIFVTAIISSGLRKRMDNMRALAYAQGIKLANSLQLNTQVVTTMQEGVIAFDHEKNIQLINSAAFKMLNLNHDQIYQHLKDLPMRFQQAYQEWQKNQTDEIFQISKHSAEIRLSGQNLIHEFQQATGQVIFIHDISKESQKAQYMKLAILGNLAANIAHEIRNPLSSVSHAAQLLNEGSDTHLENQHLIKIIRDNCDRMNTIIKNVLNISKKQTDSPEIIDINHFIQIFIRDFRPSHLPEVTIEFKPLPHPEKVFMDSSQLRQVLVNLCENGLRYSFANTQKAHLIIALETQSSPNVLLIHIQDFGKGIDGRDTKHMFEPFYTTEKNGSGLGLYLAREICQINGGQILYYPLEPFGSDFCIQLPVYQEIQHYDQA